MQGEGDTGAAAVALAQPVRRIVAVEEVANRATACGRGGSKKTKVMVALPQRKGNDSGGMAHGQWQS